MPSSSAAVRAHYGAGGEQEDREVNEYGGIYSARVEDLADHLNTTPDDLLAAIERGEAEPLVDTARQKKAQRDRPTDPAIRSLAFTTEELRALRSAVGEGE
jgi:hypothetical protein